MFVNSHEDLRILQSYHIARCAEYNYTFNVYNYVLHTVHGCYIEFT